jgi:aldose sugar dehydrogenase
MSKMEINTLSYLMLLLLIAIMIFYPKQASSTGEQTYYSSSSKNLQNEGEMTRIAHDNLGVNTSKFDIQDSVGISTTNSKPQFTRVDNESTVINIDFPIFANESFITCSSVFKCTSSLYTGWKDKTSLKISSTSNTNNTWSWIYGQTIDVKPRENYQLVTHMKLNPLATQSHVAFEGFNKTSNKWYQLTQCPHGTNGPLEWQEFNCIVIIPEDTTKIRLVLNAGWSSQLEKEATTWFDSVYLINLGKFFVTDRNLQVQLFAQGLKLPTNMAFLGEHEILVLEKDNGTVRKIIDGKIQPKPLLDVPVATLEERGMLGIAISRNETNNRTYVFLFFTESATGKDGDDINIKKEPLGNRLYRYEYVGGKLVNPKLLLDLPASPWPYHNGGVLTIGPDNNLYIAIGDGTVDSQTANDINKSLPEGRAGILRVTQNGKPVSNTVISGDKYPLNLYYAYGIRNSYGIDFDPVTGKLWDTENGPKFGDEINLVEPGFNSGWNKVQGLWTVGPWDPILEGERKENLASDQPFNLVDFNGTGKYSSPEFTWNDSVAPTAIKFLTSDKLGEQYKNDMFIADQNTFRIYHFKLNQNRTELRLQGPLADKVADSKDELDGTVFATLGQSISDLEVGPDGYLYLVSNWSGKIYRIAPQHLNNEGRNLN